MKKLEFFYDYVSIYSYLANHVVPDLPAEIVYRPMFLGAVMEATGNRPPGTVAAKGRYLHEDIARWVKRYRVPFKMNPVFPQNTLKALRLAYVLQDRKEFPGVHKALFEAMWVHGENLADDAVLRRIAEDAGLPGDETLAGIASDEIKSAVKANTEEAVARGVFGAPTFFLGEEMFFGNDRFDFIREALER